MRRELLVEENLFGLRKSDFALMSLYGKKLLTQLWMSGAANPAVTHSLKVSGYVTECPETLVPEPSPAASDIDQI